MAGAPRPARHNGPARYSDMDGRGAARGATYLRDFLLDLDRCADGSFRIVAPGYRRTKNGHYAIADVLVDRTAIAVDSRIHRLEKLTEQPMDLFGIEVATELVNPTNSALAMLKQATEYWVMVPLIRAIVPIRLNRLEEARAEVVEALKMDPTFTLAKWRDVMFYSDPSLIEQEIAHLSQAGLPEKIGPLFPQVALANVRFRAFVAQSGRALPASSAIQLCAQVVQNRAIFSKLRSGPWPGGLEGRGSAIRRHC